MKPIIGILALALLATLAFAPAAPAGDLPERMESRSAFDPGHGLFDERTGETDWFHGPEKVAAGVPFADSDKLWLRSKRELAMPAKSVEDGREFRLRVRELADRLLETEDPALAGKTIIPVSFVSSDNFERSSSFGKLVCEQLISELNRRGLKIKEYRTRFSPQSRPGAGEFALTRQPSASPSLGPDALILAGTYYFDNDNVYVNARLFTTMDGMVLAAASMVMPQSPATRTMLSKGAGLGFAPAKVEIKAFADVADQSSLGFLFSEEDLH